MKDNGVTTLTPLKYLHHFDACFDWNTAAERKYGGSALYRVRFGLAVSSVIIRCKMKCTRSCVCEGKQWLQYIWTGFALERFQLTPKCTDHRRNNRDKPTVQHCITSPIRHFLNFLRESPTIPTQNGENTVCAYLWTDAHFERHCLEVLLTDVCRFRLFL